MSDRSATGPTAATQGATPTDFDWPLGTLKLRFRPEEELEHVDDRIREDVSALACAGRTLFAACDETSTVERLVYDPDSGELTAHRTIALGEIFDLPGGPDGEMDIEGMEVDGGYLWITGSHSLKRNEPDEDDDVAEALERMADLEYDLNRSFLGRLPLVEREPGLLEPVAHIDSVDPDEPPRVAACMKMSKKGRTLLKDVLSEDPLLAPFIGAPCKENGFDIEGLAVDGDRVLLGLRGPVVGSWAVVVEVRMKTTKKGWLKPRKLPEGKRYRLHLFELGGLGVRDLLIVGDSLLLLAGPTTDIDGLQPVFVWPEYGTLDGPSMVGADRLERAIEIPFAVGADHAEGLAVLETTDGPRLVVAYDTPGEPRLDDEDNALLVDLYEVPG